jgi:hypothetical protein
LTALTRINEKGFLLPRLINETRLLDAMHTENKRLTGILSLIILFFLIGLIAMQMTDEVNGLVTISL